MDIMTGSQVCFSLVCALCLSLIGVGSALAGSKTYDTSLAERPCDIVTADMVATTFGVPVDNLQQSGPEAPLCSYQLEEDGKSLDVLLTVVAFDTDKAAAEGFRDATRSMSAEEVSARLEELGIELDESDEQFARDIGIPEPTGVQFEDVENIADQARFQTGEGSLHLQQGNLWITLTAYYGPDMKIPDEITFESVEKATSAWKKDTMDERKEQVIALAKAALAAL